MAKYKRREEMITSYKEDEKGNEVSEKMIFGKIWYPLFLVGVLAEDNVMTKLPGSSELILITESYALRLYSSMSGEDEYVFVKTVCVSKKRKKCTYWEKEITERAWFFDGFVSFGEAKKVCKEEGDRGGK